MFLANTLSVCICTSDQLQGVENLFDRQDRMASYGPTFCDVTWGAGGTTADLTLEIASKMQNMASLPHLCAGQSCFKASVVAPFDLSALLPSRSVWRP